MKPGGFEICSFTKTEFVVCPTQLIIIDCNASPNPFTEILLTCLLEYQDATLVDYIAVDEIEAPVDKESENNTLQINNSSEQESIFQSKYRKLRFSNTYWAEIVTVKTKSDPPSEFDDFNSHQRRNSWPISFNHLG